MNSVLYFFSVVVTGVAMLMDFSTAKVDNGWLLFSFFIGISMRCLQHDFTVLLSAFTGCIIPLIILSFLFLFHMIGTGDIKLFCVLGSLMGGEGVLKCMFMSFFAAAPISLALLITENNILHRLLYLREFIQEYMRTGIIKAYRQTGIEAPENIHFTVPVFMSVVLYAGGLY